VDRDGEKRGSFLQPKLLGGGHWVGRFQGKERPGPEGGGGARLSRHPSFSLARVFQNRIGGPVPPRGRVTRQTLAFPGSRRPKKIREFPAAGPTGEGDCRLAHE